MARWALVAMAGVAAGLLWGLVLVDFEPGRFEGLGPHWKCAILALPVAAAFLLALGLRWWGTSMQVTYVLITATVWVVGCVQNETAHTGSLQHWSEGVVPLFVGGVVALVAAGVVGRAARAAAVAWRCSARS